MALEYFFNRLYDRDMKYFGYLIGFLIGGICLYIGSRIEFVSDYPDGNILVFVGAGIWVITTVGYNERDNEKKLAEKNGMIIRLSNEKYHGKQ